MLQRLILAASLLGTSSLPSFAETIYMHNAYGLNQGVMNSDGTVIDNYGMPSRIGSVDPNGNGVFTNLQTGVPQTGQVDQYGNVNLDPN